MIEDDNAAGEWLPEFTWHKHQVKR